MNGFTFEMEKGLRRLVSTVLFDLEVDLEEGGYQKVSFRVYSESIIDNIKKKFKFTDIGNVYDYPNTLPQPDMIDGYDLSNNYDFFQRIATSKKLNAIMFYTIERYSINCVVMIDTINLEKFSKRVKPILQQDTRANMFQDFDFACKKREYIEVSDATGDSMKPADVIKKKVAKENLVFDSNSTIYQVMQDIKTFFKPETQSMYGRMQIAYKRGIILYGDPGNGKSAMIREIMRQMEDVTKIVINPNVNNVTRILSSLNESLKGQKAIVIIEDIDSLITSRNRSEFLNILDGVDVKSGIYFIGTTNYPDHIDPAFMNRSGRFDRTYKIDNPTPETRRAFFQSREIGELLGEYKVYKDDRKPDSDDAVVELFVQHTEGLPMASLKEIMTSTQYRLAGNDNLSVEEAVEETTGALTETKSNHLKAHESHVAQRKSLPPSVVQQLMIGEYE